MELRVCLRPGAVMVVCVCVCVEGEGGVEGVFEAWCRYGCVCVCGIALIVV